MQEKCFSLSHPGSIISAYSSTTYILVPTQFLVPPGVEGRLQYLGAAIRGELAIGG